MLPSNRSSSSNSSSSRSSQNRSRSSSSNSSLNRSSSSSKNPWLKQGPSKVGIRVDSRGRIVDHGDRGDRGDLGNSGNRGDREEQEGLGVRGKSLGKMVREKARTRRQSLVADGLLSDGELDELETSRNSKPKKSVKGELENLKNLKNLKNKGIAVSTPKKTPRASKNSSFSELESIPEVDDPLDMGLLGVDIPGDDPDDPKAHLFKVKRAWSTPTIIKSRKHAPKSEGSQAYFAKKALAAERLAKKRTEKQVIPYSVDAQNADLEKQVLAEKKALRKNAKNSKNSTSDSYEILDPKAPSQKNSVTSKNELSLGDRLTFQALAAGQGSRISKISKIKTSKMRSIIAQDVESIHQLIEVGDTDTASTMIYKRVLQALMDVVGHAEQMVHKSKGQRGTHQLNLIVGSIRDVMIDIQQAQDRGRLGETLVDRIISPTFLEIGMMILRESELLGNRLLRDLDPELGAKYKEVLAEMESRAAQFIQNRFRDVRDEARKFLQR